MKNLLAIIPSYNNEKTITNVIKQIDAGFRRYFRDYKAYILLSDGKSRDKTKEIASKVKTRAIKIINEYEGIPGKGSALRAGFELASRLGVKACCCVDADLRSIEPFWLDLLLKPIVKNSVDYVCPLYNRHKYDGTITNHICYPLTSSLYGVNIRQPIGGDFGFSTELARFWIKQHVWNSDVARFGIDIFMTSTAMASGFRVAQSKLGTKIHDSKDPYQLLNMFRQVVRIIFDLAIYYHPRWKRITGIKETKIIGERPFIKPPVVSTNIPRLISLFKSDAEHFIETWKKILGEGTFLEIKKLTRIKSQDYHKPSKFNFSPNLWCKVVYDFLLAFREWNKKERLINMLIPLYFARAASFALETKVLEPTKAEKLIEEQARIFSELKPYLIEKWKEKRKDRYSAFFFRKWDHERIIKKLE